MPSRDVPEIERRWTIRTTEHGGVRVSKCPPRQHRIVGEVEVMPVSDHERVVAAKEQELAHGMPDDSPGDVIGAEPDGTIILDDGITTWNPARATAFLLAAKDERIAELETVRDAALAYHSAEHRDRLRAEADLASLKERLHLADVLLGQANALVLEGAEPNQENTFQEDLAEVEGEAEKERQRLDEAETVNAQLLSEREGLRARRPDLSPQEIKALLAPEDQMPTDRSEYLRASAREKLRAALAASTRPTPARPVEAGARGEERSWTFYVHPDGEFASINDGRTGDTLLRVGGQQGPPGDGDVAQVRAFAEFVASTQPDPQDHTTGHVADSRRLADEGKRFWIWRSRIFPGSKWHVFDLDLPESLKRELASENVEVLELVPVGNEV